MLICAARFVVYIACKYAFHAERCGREMKPADAAKHVCKPQSVTARFLCFGVMQRLGRNRLWARIIHYINLVSGSVNYRTKNLCTSSIVEIHFVNETGLPS